MTSQLDADIGRGSSRLHEAGQSTERPVAPSRNGAVSPSVARNTRPIFVVGCPRSGTTLLYDMIQSSGGFARAPLESDTFRVFGPKFPRLSSPESRRRLLEFWLESEYAPRSGLTRADLEPRVLAECRNIGDFLRIVMEAICQKQGVHRWAEKTPDHALYIREIKRFFPDALILHIIRDGRDAALSLANFGRIRPFFWDAGRTLLAFGVYWKWIVRKARAGGRRFASEYYELHYEDLVANPQETLAGLGAFIHHKLEYDRILESGLVRKPDSSFASAASAEDFKPVGRWRRQYSSEELQDFEALAGDCLVEMGYPLASDRAQRRRTFSAAAIAAFYLSQLELKHQLKSRTPLGRLAGWRN
jgi:Sulfotransferase family